MCIPNRTLLAILISLTTFVWAAALLFLGIPISWEYAKPYGIALTVVTFLLWSFNTYFWRKWPFSWVLRMPNLQGTWLVELNSTYVDPRTGKRADAIVAFASVRQKFSELSLRLMTHEQSSKLIAHKFVFDGDQTVELIGAYQSDPSIHLRGSVSEIHYGAFKLSIPSSPGEGFEGHYWTDRNTTGSIRYIERRLEVCEKYDTAEALFGSSR